MPNAPDELLFAASLLYLFHAPSMGGTGFYAPRLPATQIEQLLADAQTLDRQQFIQRYGVQANYLTASNDYFEQIGHIPAAWNRFIFYDGGQFHAAQIEHPALLNADPRLGRLTLNSFLTCKRKAT
jgi:hypothetical protein